MNGMGMHKAVVQKGRLRLDEPTDLPEGTVVDLEEVDPYAYLDQADDLEDTERGKLNSSIDKGLAELDAGRAIPAEQVLKELDEL